MRSTMHQRLFLAMGLLTLFGCQISKSQEQYEPSMKEVYFTVTPETHTVLEGKPVTLRCEAKPDDIIRYSWRIDGQPLAPSPRRYPKDGNLIISRVNRLLDSGSFVCTATHLVTGITIESSPAKLDIQCK
ncbi:hypothetical protein QAD02_014628 [Eretmocerus hayati]|uniref:Uncharacterized protein n=1 Tax=Eretmocerus hayati TaxID=131215 RepID=A0ACC2P730_9HYME|nr:hypothetical protein QAD02_014628 [Eretmocerus hayati]